MLTRTSRAEVVSNYFILIKNLFMLLKAHSGTQIRVRFPVCLGFSNVDVALPYSRQLVSFHSVTIDVVRPGPLLAFAPYETL